MPVSVAPGAPLVDRAAELQVAVDAVAAARCGRGRVFLVRGDAGVGKSTLVREVARRADAMGAMTMLGRAVEGGGPFRPLVEALAPVVTDAALADRPALAPYKTVLTRLLPGWSSGFDTSSHEEVSIPLVDPTVVLGEALLRLFAELAGDTWALVVLDDLHWADPDTLKVLEYLAGRITTAPVLLIGAARSDEQEAARLAPVTRHPDTTEVVLARLGEAAIETLLEMHAGSPLPEAVVAEVVAAADGVPFVAVELIDGLVESGALQRQGDTWKAIAGPLSQVPSSFAGVVERRLARLDRDTRELMSLAAVIGPVLDGELLASVSGRPIAEVAVGLRQALDCHLVARDPSIGHVVWRHALTREAVLEGLLPLERQALAERAARSLLTDGAELCGERRLVAVDLLEVAGLLPEAAALLRAAAEEAVHAAALHAAEAMLLRAERLGEARHDLAQDIAVDLVRVSTLTGRVDVAQDVAARWLPRLTGAARVRLQHAVARALVAVDRWEEAAACLPEEPGDDPRVATLLAQVALARERPAEAKALAERAIDRARELGEHEVVCEGLEVIGRCLRRSEPERAQRAFEAAEMTAVAADLAPWRIRALLELGAMDMLRGGSLARLKTARELALEAGMLGRVAVLDLQIGAAMCTRSGRVAALPTLEQAVARAHDLGMGQVRAMGLVLLSAGYFLAGRDAEARSAIDEASRLEGAPVDVHTSACVLGLHEWLTTGDDERTAELLELGLDSLRGHPLAGPTPWWGAWAVLRTALDDNGAAIAELRDSDVVVHAPNEAALGYASAIQAARAGRHETAQRMLAGAEAVLEELPYWRHVMRCLSARSAHRWQLADEGSWLREALAYFEQQGEALFAARCRALMRELGIAVPRHRERAEDMPPQLRAYGITGREFQVLRLVAERLSNAEIAARLHLSPRTVETHVSNLLTKTGASSRSTLSEHV